MRKKTKKGSVSVSKQAPDPKPMPPELWTALAGEPGKQQIFFANLENQHLFAGGTPKPSPFASAPRLPIDSAERKNIPLADFFDYFPDAVCAVAEVIRAGQTQHQTDKWDRGKSIDHASCLLRHFLERGSVDTDGMRHSAKVAIRALMSLQLEIEQEKGLPPSRGSK
jgi:hypothetical protein